MTIKERLYVNYYIETLSDRKAQKEAGIEPYNPNLKNDPEINRLISEKLEEYFSTLDITDKYILSRIKQVAEDASRPVPKIKIDNEGNEIYYHDEDGNQIFERDYGSELRALELLGKYRSLFTDKKSIDVTTDFEKFISKASDKEEW